MNYLLNSKQIFILMSFCLICLFSEKGIAQITDRIIKKDSTELNVIVLKTKSDKITYRMYGQFNGPFFSIPKSEVDKIILRRGSITYFSARERDSVESKAPFVPIYFDTSVGLGLGYLADINVGYRFNEKHAIGVSCITWGRGWTNMVKANGIGVQWRYTPTRKTLLKFELGYIINAHYADDASSYNASYSHKESNKIYQRFSYVKRFGAGICGVSFALATSQVNRNYEVNTYKYLRSSTFDVTSFVLNLGLAIPRFYKRIKK